MGLVPYLFLGFMGIICVAVLARSVFAGLFLTVSIWLAWDRGFDFRSALMVLCFLFMLVGELPVYFSGNKDKLPKMSHSALGLVVSLLWLSFAGVVAWGMLYSDLPNKLWYWFLVAAVVLSELPALGFYLMFLFPKSRKLLEEELEEINRKLDKPAS